MNPSLVTMGTPKAEPELAVDPYWIGKILVEMNKNIKDFERTVCKKKSFDELLAEGKSFKEINNIMKEGK